MAAAVVAAGVDNQRKSQGEPVVKKRNMNPGRFVRGNRIYDSELGETCHWCRQKTVEHHVRCSRCIVKFCGACLVNRHGENILQEMLENVLWVCPKCRGGCGPGCDNCCNCGPCRKSQGLGPTGLMIWTAKAANFTNVHDFLVYLCTGESQDEIAKRKLGRCWTWGGGAIVPLPTPTESGLKRKTVAPADGPSKPLNVEGPVVDVKCELSPCHSAWENDMVWDEDLASPSACPSNFGSRVDEDEQAMKCESLSWDDDEPTGYGVQWAFSWETKTAESDNQEKSGDCIPAPKIQGEDALEEEESEYFTTAGEFPSQESLDSVNCSSAPEMKIEESSEQEDFTSSADIQTEEDSDQEDFHDCSVTPQVKREESLDPEESKDCTCAEWEEFENWIGTLEAKREHEEFDEVKEEATAQQGSEDFHPARDGNPQREEWEEWEDCILPPMAKRDESPEREEWKEPTSDSVKDLPVHQENTEDCPFVGLFRIKKAEQGASSAPDECAGSDNDLSFKALDSSPSDGYVIRDEDQTCGIQAAASDLPMIDVKVQGQVPNALQPLPLEMLSNICQEISRPSQASVHNTNGDQLELKVGDVGLASRGPLKPRRYDCKCTRCVVSKDHLKDDKAVESNAVITLSDSDSDPGGARRRVQSLTTPPFRPRNLRDSFTCCTPSSSALPDKAQNAAPRPHNVSEHRGLPTCLSGNEFQQKLDLILKESFNQQELKEKMELVTHRKPMEKERQMRQRAIPFKSAQQGLSYLDHYPGFEEKLSAARDDEEKLTLLRGFFFWIQYPMLQGAYAPWTREPGNNADSDCVEVGPDCKVLAVYLPVNRRKNVRRSLRFPVQRDALLKTFNKKTGPFRVKVESEIPRPKIPFV